MLAADRLWPAASQSCNLIGTAVAQFPSLSHTFLVFVAAFAVCVFAATFVVSVKDASDAFARPTPPSVAVQLMLTSVLCQAASGEPHEKVGPAVSMFTVAV